MNNLYKIKLDGKTYVFSSEFNIDAAVFYLKATNTSGYSGNQKIPLSPVSEIIPKDQATADSSWYAGNQQNQAVQASLVHPKL